MMRRTSFLVLGVLEIASAAVLFLFVWQLPGPDDVRDKVGRAERVGRQTGVQIRKLRDEVRLIRQGQPHARHMAEAMREQLQYMAESLKRQQLDFVALKAIHDSFGEVANGLDGMADRLAPDGVAQLGQAMGLTADFLDKQICPAAESAAGHLDRSIVALRTDARTLKDAPAQMARELSQFAEDLSRALHETARLRELARALRSGRDGLEHSLGAVPELRKSLTATATLLRNTQRQMKDVLDRRGFYEASLQNTRSLITGLSAAVPMYTEQWGSDVAEQERSLSALDSSIDDLTAVMPEVKIIGSRLMVMTRLLLGLLGAIFLLHGGHLAINGWGRNGNVLDRK